jgi:hypothetical protein
MPYNWGVITMPVISIHERDHERHNVLITTPMQQSPAWDCDQFDDLHAYHTYSHEYFVAYATINTKNGAVYQGLHCLWNCKVDGLPSRHNVGRWIISHNALLRDGGATDLQVLTASAYHSATQKHIATI